MAKSRFVRCKQCGALNEPRAVFCSRCGASLPRSWSGAPRPRFNAANLAMAAALILALAIIAFVLYTTVAHSLDKSVDVVSYADQEGIPASTEPPISNEPTDADDTATDSDDSQTDTASTTTTEPPLIIRPRATVSSSALAGTATASFQATNLLDGNLTTAWIEGATGLGLGEWVRFDLINPTVLARIEIANGYQKDVARFASNPRVRLVNLEYSSGATQLVELYDTRDLQYIIPPNEAVEWVQLVIVSVYSGANSDGASSALTSISEDTSLSEVHIYEKVD